MESFEKQIIKILKVAIIITGILIIYSFNRNDKIYFSDEQIENVITENKLENKNIKQRVKKIPIFTFHRIVSDKLKTEKFMNNEWAASIDVFDRQMKYLYDKGYKTISMDQLYCWYMKKCEFSKKVFMITFDDGNVDDYYIVMPVLRKYNFKATTFIVGSRTLDIEEKPYNENDRSFITRELITKTKNIYPNLDYQSHTWDLHQVDPNGKERVLNLSEKELAEDFKNNSKFGFKYLAYPYGVYNDKMLRQLKKNGYRLAFTFRTHDYATRNSKQYEIPRIKINGFSDVDEIKKWID